MKTKNSGHFSPGAIALDPKSSEPLLAQIADYYRKQIIDGEIPNGHHLPTCQELSRNLGLAAQTINRAFDLLAKEGLVHRRRSLGTIVGPPKFLTTTSSGGKAQSHRRAMSPICLVLRKDETPSEEKELAGDYLNGLMEGFNAWKCRFEIAYLQADQPDLDLVRTLVETGQTRGMINLGLHPDAMEYLIEKQFPVVSLHEDFADRGITSVMADHVRGYAEAWKIAIDGGHSRIAFFGFQDKNSARRQRECVAGGKLADTTHELQVSVFAPNDADSPAMWDALVRELGPWTEDGSWPTLFFAQTDLIATRLIRSLKEHGVAVPHAVSVIGFNDSMIARHFHPTLTTLAKPRFKMGLAASQLLLNILAHRPVSADRLQVFPVALVHRETFIPIRK